MATWLEIDGKVLDLTNPQSFAGLKIIIKEGGYIEQCKDGEVVKITKEDLENSTSLSAE